MKLVSMIKSVLLTASLFFSSLCFALTAEQKRELYEWGIITVYDDYGQKQGHFEVHFIPGANNVIRDAKERWAAAIDLMDDFVDVYDFWGEKFFGSFLSGLKYMKQCVYDNGIFAIPDDYRALCEANREIDGSFGANAVRLKNWLMFGVNCIGRGALSVWGIGAGSVYAFLVPAGHVIYRPIAAGTKALVSGTFWPGLKYSWNGTAWILTKDSSEPKPGDLTVTFVPEALPELAEVQ